MKYAKTMLAIVAAMALTLVVAAHAETGKLKVCRSKTIVAASDGKAVRFPAINYVSGCDKNMENCRRFDIAAEEGSIGKSRSDCTILKAHTTDTDGTRIKAGTVVYPRYSFIDNFENKGFDRISEIFISTAVVTVAEEFK